MNRYLCFTGSNYYPLGGWEDFLMGFNELDQAIAAIWKDATDDYPEDKWRMRWGHVYDTQENRIVWKDGKHT